MPKAKSQKPKAVSNPNQGSEPNKALDSPMLGYNLVSSHRVALSLIPRPNLSHSFCVHAAIHDEQNDSRQLVPFLFTGACLALICVISSATASAHPSPVQCPGYGPPPPSPGGEAAPRPAPPFAGPVNTAPERPSQPTAPASPTPNSPEPSGATPDATPPSGPSTGPSSPGTPAACPPDAPPLSGPSTPEPAPQFRPNLVALLVGFQQQPVP